MPREQKPADDEEELQELTWQQYFRTAPAWLVSTVVHAILLIVMALIVLSRPGKNISVIDLKFAENLGDTRFEDQLDFGPDQEVPETTEMVITPSEKLVDDPFAAPPKLPVAMTSTPFMSSDIAAPQAGLALRGRSEGFKQGMLRKGGGNALTEAAVALALKWLAKQQLQDGSWSLKGPYKDGVGIENTCAATAMAMLAFQGAGHVHNKPNQYKDVVAKGLKYLVKMQADDGSFFTESSHHRFYTQGQCTIALCELYAMTGDPDVKGPAEKAVAFCVASQSSLGGWRYNERDDDNDVSVTGWILMGLQSAKMGGLDVPQKTLDKITRFLDAASTNGGSLYGYLAHTAEPRASMTAEALLCRQYLGWPKSHEKLNDGIKWLMERHMPAWGERDVYYWYYGTQVMHHMEGEVWTKWNDVMKNLLTTNQVKAGNEAGSWNPDGDEWGPNGGGRLYVTCLSVYMLEVYYRHLPLYSDVKLN